MEKVTIIIPAYNAEGTIEKCIRSACGQTYPELEIIVINDGSSDRTEEICRCFGEKDSRLIVRTTENRGVSAARNLGLELASGTWIVFLDADDILLEDAVKELMKYRTGTDWVIGNYYMSEQGGKGTIMRHAQYFTEAVHRGMKSELPELCCSRNFHCVWGKLFKAKLISEYGLYFHEDKSYGEDLLFNMDYFSFVRNFTILRKEVYGYCYTYGKGLGTRLIDNEWEIQKDIFREMEYRINNVYRIDETAYERINHFYFSQAVSVIQRIAGEKRLGRLERKRRIQTVTDSWEFREIVQREAASGRLHPLDRILLRHGFLYSKIHEFYAAHKLRRNQEEA